MSGISSALTSGGTRCTRSPPATIAISSEQTCFPPPTRWQLALIHDEISGGALGFARTLIGCPGIEKRIEPRPRRFHFVAPREKGRIAEHRLEQQSFVSLGRLGAERSRVAELHGHRRRAHGWSRNFRVELQRDSFIG